MRNSRTTAASRKLLREVYVERCKTFLERCIPQQKILLNQEEEEESDLEEEEESELELEEESELKEESELEEEEEEESELEEEEL